MQTTSQIGFIVRLMKAITRGRVVLRARGIARRRGRGWLHRASHIHACIQGETGDNRAAE